MKWFYNMKIGKKLIVTFILIALFSGIVGVLGIENINSISSKDKELYQENTLPMTYLTDMGMGFERMRINIVYLMYKTSNSSEYLQKIKDREKTIRDAMVVYEKTTLTNEESKEYNSYKSNFEKYIQLRDQLISLVQQGNVEQALAINTNEVYPLGGKIEESIDKLSVLTSDEAKNMSDQNTETAKNSMIEMLVIIAAAILLAIALSIFVSRIISNPIKKLAETADKLAVGEINVNVEANTKDEIGELMKSFGKMIDNTREQAYAAERIANGDLSVQIKPKSDNDILNKEMLKMVGNIKALIDEMEKLHKEQKAGEIDYFISSEKFKGAYSEVAEGVNGLVKLHIGNMLKVLDITTAYAEGDFSKVLEKLPGKQALANEKMDLLRDNLQNLIIEMVNLSQDAIKGHLNARGDAQKFYGDYRKIINGVNETLNAIIEPIKETSEVLEEMAKGNLQVAVKGDYQGDHALIKNAINATIKSFNEVLNDINNASEQVATGAKQVSASSMALSQGATEQASSIEELTASIEEVSSQTKLNAENANQANNLAEAAKENAVQGNDQMQEMLKAMEEINEASSNISKIIKVIDEIAFQTNILALNAAVEAARAGEHGMGFAVVAGEVRNLAARSANAAKETTAMIEGSIKKVEVGTKIANETAEALNRIVKDVSQAASLVSDIAVASNEQATGIAQITQGISQVSQVVQTNTATSEESAAASEELSSQAEVLKEQVSRFKLKQNIQAYNKFENLNPEVMRMLESMMEKKKNNSIQEIDYSTEAAATTSKIVLSDREFGKY